MIPIGRWYVKFGGVVVIAAVIVVACLVAAGLIVKVRQHLRQSAMSAGQALLSATERGDIEQMQGLLAQRVEVNTRNLQGWTSLHVAAAGGDIAVVELLLRHGADVNAQSHVGATPLDNAITYSQNRAVVALLEAHGAQGNTSWDSLF
jgi:ankyrin repeat protein